MNSERNVLKLINDISNLTLFVVDQSTLQILYCNQTAAKAGFRRGVFYHPDTLSFDAVNFHQGDYQYFAEKSILGSNVDVRVKRTLWDDEGRQIPALAISVTPHIFAGEVKIRHDHSKDLLQGIDVLFDEYVVIDLVDDRYISPKLGPCASAFPHAGDFTQANDLYGKMLIHPEDRQKFWELTSTKSLRQNMPQENMHIVGELRRLVAPDSFEWIETHLVSTIDAQTGHLKVLWCYRNIEKQKQFELSQREQTAWIAQLSEEYYAVYLVNLSNNTLRGLRVPEQFKKMYDYIEAFGLMDKTGIDLPGEAKGILYNEKNVGPVELATISFGQSISVTPIQLITAISSIANGGDLMQPRVVKSYTDNKGNITETVKPKKVRSVISKETSKKMLEIAESVVTEGGGKIAYIPGYRLGGKTGTAQKVIDGKYAPGKYICSFVGIAPCDDPQIVVLAIVDEPTGVSAFGSTTAGPIVKEIMNDSLKYLGVKPVYKEEEKAEYEKKQVKVPDVRNLKIGDAVKALEDAKLKPDLDADIELPEDTKVKDIFPKPGVKVNEDSSITLYFEN